jgi:hypothetical protein
LSLSGQIDQALARLEVALAKGYHKFDRIAADPDLKALREKPAFAQLIARYRAGAATAKPSSVQRLQTAAVPDRAELLVQALRSPGADGAELAGWAMYEPDPELRVLSMRLWRKLDVAQSGPALVCGLYDANGYVSKAAASALVHYGRDVTGILEWTLADRGTPGPFYAMQVLAAVGAHDSAGKIVPLLRDGDPKVRIMAAESLARLRAVSALPQVEAAAKHLPAAEQERGFYQAAFRRALAVLHDVKNAGGK